MAKKVWTKEEIDFIRSNRHLTIKELAKILNRTENSVKLFKSKYKIKTKHFWSKEKVEFIRNNKHLNNKDLSKIFNVTKSSIHYIKTKNKIKTKHFWSKEEIDFIRGHKYLTHKELGLIFGTPAQSIASIKTINKIIKGHIWTKEKVEFIRNNQHLTNEELGKIFGVKIASIYQIKSKNNLTKSNKWKEGEIKILKEYYPKYPNKLIAKKLNKSVGSLTAKANILKIKKPKELMDKMRNAFTEKEINYIKKYYSTTMNDELAEKLGRSKASIMNIVKTKLKLYKNPIKIKECRSNCSKELWKQKSFQEKVQKSLHLRPNKPETFLINLFEKNNLPYKYTGDYSLWIDGKNPDFIDLNSKKIIEMFGIIYHSPEKSFIHIPYGKTEQGTIEHYKKNGYDTLVVWDTELKNEEILLKKISAFHNNQLGAST